MPILRIQSPSGATQLAPTVCESNCWFDPSGGLFARWGVGGATVAATLLDWQQGAARDLASVTVDPLLRDLAARDVHLTGASPCRGASIVAANLPLDADGQPRPPLGVCVTERAPIRRVDSRPGRNRRLSVSCAADRRRVPGREDARRAAWPFVAQTPSPTSAVGAFAMPFSGGVARASRVAEPILFFERPCSDNQPR
jgi:hypothetical protein